MCVLTFYIHLPHPLLLSLFLKKTFIFKIMYACVYLCEWVCT